MQRVKELRKATVWNRLIECDGPDIALLVVRNEDALTIVGLAVPPSLGAFADAHA